MSRYTGLIPDSAGLGGIPSSAMGGLSEELLPWLVNVDVFMTPSAHTNFNTNTVDTSAVLTAYRVSSGAQNDLVDYEVTLAAGTWTFELVHYKDADNGIFSVQFDTVEKGTIDAYAAALSRNNRSQITGIAVATTDSITLRLKMATKHASSTNYYGKIQHIQLKRTA